MPGSRKVAKKAEKEGKKSRIVFCIALCTVLPLIFVCCSKPIKAPCPSSIAAGEQLGTFSEKPSVNIYLDASESMRGFVNPIPQTCYDRIIKNIESSVYTTWPRGRLYRKKFGTQINAITHTDFLSAADPNFYNEAATRIDLVIADTDANNLSLIITDLFQNDADTLMLTQQIFEKIVRAGLAVGILGITSQYDGVISDFGIDNLQFYYSSGNDPIRFRPFYILMLGKHEDIIQYCKRLRLEYLDSNNFMNQFCLISRYIVRTLPDFRKSTVLNTFHLKETHRLLLSCSDNRVKQFQLNRNANSGTFQVALEYDREPFTMYSSFNVLDKQVSLINHTDLIVKSLHEAEEALKVKSIQINPNKIIFDVSFDATNLPPGSAVYCYQVTLNPQPEAYIIPEWVSRWNMDTSNLWNWRNAPNSFRGNATLNLHRLIDEINQTMIRSIKPKLAEIYFYVYKK